jgi:hypothetical protein
MMELAGLTCENGLWSALGIVNQTPRASREPMGLQLVTERKSGVHVLGLMFIR